MGDLYAELHCASAFSFLEGASQPEDLVERAVELGLPAVALIDRNTVSGAPRFWKAAKEAGIKPLVGAEVVLDENSQFSILNSQFLTLPQAKSVRKGRVHRRCLASRHDVVLKPPAAAE